MNNDFGFQELTQDEMIAASGGGSLSTFLSAVSSNTQIFGNAGFSYSDENRSINGSLGLSLGLEGLAYTAALAGNKNNTSYAFGINGGFGFTPWQ